MKIVQIDPKENIITGTLWQTLWYAKDAEGFEQKFRDEVKNAVQKSGFPDIVTEDVTVKTGGCFSPYKAEQFEAVQIYSQKKELESFRCCFTAEQFGNIMHIRIYFIENTKGGCAKLINKIISIFEGGGLVSLKFNRYSEAWTDFIGMLFDQAIENLPIKPAFKEKGEESSSKAGGLLDKLGKLGG